MMVLAKGKTKTGNWGPSPSSISIPSGIPEHSVRRDGIGAGGDRHRHQHRHRRLGAEPARSAPPWGAAGLSDRGPRCQRILDDRAFRIPPVTAACSIRANSGIVAAVSVDQAATIAETGRIKRPSPQRYCIVGVAGEAVAARVSAAA